MWEGPLSIARSWVPPSPMRNLFSRNRVTCVRESIHQITHVLTVEYLLTELDEGFCGFEERKAKPCTYYYLVRDGWRRGRSPTLPVKIPVPMLRV